MNFWELRFVVWSRNLIRTSISDLDSCEECRWWVGLVSNDNTTAILSFWQNFLCLRMGLSFTKNCVDHKPVVVHSNDNRFYYAMKWWIHALSIVADMEPILDVILCRRTQIWNFSTGPCTESSVCGLTHPTNGHFCIPVILFLLQNHSLYFLFGSEVMKPCSFILTYRHNSLNHCCWLG